jgi:hypothetical protein
MALLRMLSVAKYKARHSQRKREHACSGFASLVPHTVLAKKSLYSAKYLTSNALAQASFRRGKALP